MKTPKEKAKELVDKFNDNMDFNTLSVSKHLEYAKQCALICVDEVLPVFNTYHSYELYQYYKEVEQEIKKL